MLTRNHLLALMGISLGSYAQIPLTTIEHLNRNKLIYNDGHSWKATARGSSLVKRVTETANDELVPKVA